MQFHLIYLLGYIGKDLAYDQASFIDILAGYQPLILYGLFFILSIWSFTSLMDGSFVMSFPIEILKTGLGILLIYTYPDVTSIYESINIPKIYIIAYLSLSLLMTIIYSSKKSNWISHLISG